MKLIEIKSLFKTYENKNIKNPALNGVDLIIKKGDFLCIAGPSGSGKTTLLNMLGALDKPDSGSIFYEEVDITSFSLTQLSGLRLRKIGFVFQAYNLIPTLTALENAEYPMFLQGIDKKTRMQKSAEILERVGLKDCFHKTPPQLSGGQQQRVAVARAIVSQPQVILADEPTANLDSTNANLLMDLMRQLNQEKGTTFIFTTHDKLVMDKADKVILLKDGKIIN